MRTAICISGQLRNFDDPIIVENLYKYVINPLNADVFIDTWYDRGDSFYVQTGIIQAEYDIKETVEETKIKELYKPISLHIEDFKNWETNLIPNELKRNILKNGRPYIGGTAMFYKINGANNLKKQYEKENNFKYDLVIRSRFDNIFFKKIEDEYLKNLNVLWNNNCPAIYMNYRVHDTLNFSNSQIMDTFSDIYENLPRYWDDPNYLVLDKYDSCRVIKICCLQNNIIDKSYKDRSMYDVYYTKDSLKNVAYYKEDVENRKIIDQIHSLLKNGISFDELLLYLNDNSKISVYNWCVYNHYIKKDGNLRFWEY